MATYRRAERPERFAFFDASGLDDRELSWKAKGILSFLLSLPDDWTVRKNHLDTMSTDGRDSTSTGIQELVDRGYIVRSQSRRDDGTFDDVEWTVFDIPDGEEPSRRVPTANGKSVSGLPGSGSTGTGQPATTNKKPTNEESTNEDNDFVDGAAVESLVERLIREAKQSSNKQAKIVAAFESLFPDLEAPSFQEAYRLFAAMKRLCRNAPNGAPPEERVVRAFAYVRSVRPGEADPVAWTFDTIEREAKRDDDERTADVDEADVVAYFVENGSDKETGRKFFRSFAARDWRIYGDPIANWKPLADSWIERGSSDGASTNIVFSDHAAAVDFWQRNRRSSRTTFGEFFDVVDKETGQIIPPGTRDGKARRVQYRVTSTDLLDRS